MMRARLSRWAAHVRWRVARLAEGPVKAACALVFAVAATLARRRTPGTPAGRLRVGIVVHQFPGLGAGPGSLGGFGQTARLVADALRTRDDDHDSPWVIVSPDLGLAARVEVRRIDGTGVLLVPSLPRLLLQPFTLARLLDRLRLDVLVSIDFLPKYEYVLWSAPRVPLVIYLGDPRGPREWERIATVDLEQRAHGRPHRRAMIDLAAQHRGAYRRVRRWGRWFGRPFAFATIAHSLVERARDKFGEPGLQAHYLPIPLPLPPEGGGGRRIPVQPGDNSSRPLLPPPRPMLLFLGRLDPQKRPWIVYALARRLPAVDFVVAGPDQTGLVEPLIARQGDSPNLRRVGLVLGEAKDALLRECCALLNTSNHEGLPVTFLEAFSHAKPVVSSVDPDGLVSRFGYPAGDVPGDGVADRDLEAFDRAIRACIGDEAGRRERGEAARRFVEETCSPERFREHFRSVFDAEGP